MSHFYLYRVEPKNEGHRFRLAGAFYWDGTNFQVQADYFGNLSGYPQGVLDQRSRRRLEALLRNPYFRTVPREELRQGQHPELIQAADMPESDEPTPSETQPAQTESSRPPAVFQYHRVGMSEPVLVEMHNGRMVLNGHTLTTQEAHRVMQNVRQKLATVRYHGLAKAEGQGGQQIPDDLLSMDPMVPGLGSRYGFDRDLKQGGQGVHISLSLNGLGGINTVHGEEVGDRVVQTLGHCLRESLGSGKAYRVSGDRYQARFQEPTAASEFLRSLRERLSRIPAIGGTHVLSVAAGMSDDPDKSREALKQARAARDQAKYQPGQAQTHVFIMMPDQQGPVPLSPEKLPLERPEEKGEPGASNEGKKPA